MGTQVQASQGWARESQKYLFKLHLLGWFDSSSTVYIVLTAVRRITYGLVYCTDGIHFTTRREFLSRFARNYNIVIIF